MRKLEPDALVAVCGCFSELEPESVAKLSADLIGGTSGREEFALMVEKLVMGAPGNIAAASGMESVISTFSSKPDLNVKSATTAKPAPHVKPSRTRALLKIQDGCDNFCAYCVVPYARGRSRSVLPESIAEQAKQLEEQGYKEIVITGIEISSYGKDLDSGATVKDIVSDTTGKDMVSDTTGKDMVSDTTGKNLDNRTTLIDATQAIGNAAPKARLRLGSLDPAIVSDEFCVKLSAIPNICNHFHLSLQSGCDATLDRMGRRYNTSIVLQTISSLRKHFSDCGITADLIVGFPGETDDEFTQTLEFIKKAAFSEMHIFPFSPRPGTKAADMPEQIDKSVKRERARKAAESASQSAGNFKRAQIGKTVQVLFEQEKNGYSIGHSSNYLEIAVKDKAEKNSLHNVKITNLLNNLLQGEII